MKTNSHNGTALRTAIVQLQHVAKKKRVRIQSDSHQKSMSMQEARQIEEAIRLLRWIRD